MISVSLDFSDFSQKLHKVGVGIMRKLRKRSFEELVQENKTQLLKDQSEIERIEIEIEKRLEDRMLERAE